MKHYRPLVLIALILLLLAVQQAPGGHQPCRRSPSCKPCRHGNTMGAFRGNGWASPYRQRGRQAAMPSCRTWPSCHPGSTTLALDEQGVRLGWAVAGAGLVNGDSYADILVGADKGGADREGWAGLFLGSNGGPQSMAAWQVIGEKKGDLFGGAVDGAGDVNHDGYADIMVGASNYEGHPGG